MRTTCRIALTFSLAACAFANRLPTNQVRGEYIEARTADIYTGPCFANSEMNHTGDLAVIGWSIEKGEWNGVKLDGLKVAAVLRAQSTLGVDPGAVRSVLILDEKAGLSQRLALRAFAENMGDDLLAEIVRTETAPMKFQSANVHSRFAVFEAGELARVATRPLAEGDQICHNERTYYDPLTRMDHAMPAFTEALSFQGKGLGTTWSYPGKRSSFVGTFDYKQ
jgi:hypothetical protein